MCFSKNIYKFRYLPVKIKPVDDFDHVKSSEDNGSHSATIDNGSTTVQTTCKVATQTEMSVFYASEVFTQCKVSIFHLTVVGALVTTLNVYLILNVCEYQ